MIFLAVTLGFFAENIREDISSHNKEKQYMQSMLEDLEQDSLMLHNQYIASLYLAEGLDSLRTVLYEDINKINLQELYRLQITYGRYVTLGFSAKTSSQLKAGGMNFIENTKVTNAISDYWIQEDVLNNDLQNITGKVDHATELKYEIFNLKYVKKMMPDNTDKITSVIDPDCKLLKDDPVLLVDYANRLTYISLILKSHYNKDIYKEYEAAINLKKLIQKEYHLKYQ
jgi:hypothetical protein